MATSRMAKLRMPRSLRRDVVFHRRLFDRITEHPLFQFAVCHGEAVMLPLMFGPGIQQKRLYIYIGRFRVVVDSPARSTIAPANSLILINLVQEIGALGWIDDIFDGNQNWPKVGGLFLEHAQFAPMIPRAEIDRRAWKPKSKLQEQGRAHPNPGNEEGHANVGAF